MYTLESRSARKSPFWQPDVTHVSKEAMLDEKDTWTLQPHVFPLTESKVGGGYRVYLQAFTSHTTQGWPVIVFVAVQQGKGQVSAPDPEDGDFYEKYSSYADEILKALRTQRSVE
jgi:hypothetical protein